MDNKLKCTMRLTLYPADTEKQEWSFGPGSAQLLRGVAEHGSLNRAAKDMGMAYSKAWKGIKRTEELFGFQLLERRGAHGSVLTDEARWLLDRFDRAVEIARKAAQDFLDHPED